MMCRRVPGAFIQAQAYLQQGQGEEMVVSEHSKGFPRKPLELKLSLWVIMCWLALVLLPTCIVQAADSPQVSSSTTSTAAMRLALALKAPIEQGMLEVEAVDHYIVIRIPEKDAFPPASTTLRPAYLPVLTTVRAALKPMNAVFTVAGHTDDVAISTAKYRSNWEFAAGRSSTIIVELLKTSELAPERFTLVSYGATRPRVDNANAENRAHNRRVEIVIQQM